MKERNLEKLLARKVKDAGGLCWKFVSPGSVDVPDRVCIKDGRVVFVEVKTTERKPRTIQTHRIQQLKEHNIPALVIDEAAGIEEVLDALHAA